jgi:hypothetical protein
MLVVFVVLLIIAVLGIPELRHMIVRAKLTGAASETAAHFTLARMEAIKRGRPVVLVPVFETVAFFGFVDLDNDLTADAGEEVLFDHRVPADMGQRSIYFVGPTGDIGTAESPSDSIWGWTAVPGSPVPVAVFESDGSVRDEGGIRIGDSQAPRRNIFEVRISPQATARVEIRKYAWEGAGGPPDFYRGGAGLWKWY